MKEWCFVSSERSDGFSLRRNLLCGAGSDEGRENLVE
jgi:hypothetical protein